MTSKQYGCCEKCLEKIARKHTNAARLWADLCGLSVTKGEYIRVRSGDFHELRLLEMDGYVCSIESPPNHLIIRVYGHFLDKEGMDNFCMERIGHG